MSHGPGSLPIEIDCTSSIPDCPRCGQPGLLSARVPHGFERADGQRSNGTTVVVLCSACDADDRYGGPLITYFHVHEDITPETLHDCANLIMLWSENIRLPQLDIEAFEAEAEAWRRGDL